MRSPNKLGIRFTRRAIQLGIPASTLRELMMLYSEEYLVPPMAFEQMLEVLE